MTTGRMTYTPRSITYFIRGRFEPQPSDFSPANPGELSLDLEEPGGDDLEERNPNGESL